MKRWFDNLDLRYGPAPARIGGRPGPSLSEIFRGDVGMRRAWSPPELGHTKQDEQDELVGRFFDNKISEAHLRARLQILGCYEKMISQIVSSVRYERDETGRQRAHRAKKK